MKLYDNGIEIDVSLGRKQIKKEAQAYHISQAVRPMKTNHLQKVENWQN